MEGSVPYPALPGGFRPARHGGASVPNLLGVCPLRGPQEALYPNLWPGGEKTWGRPLCLRPFEAPTPPAPSHGTGWGTRRPRQLLHTGLAGALEGWGLPTGLLP